MKGVTALVEALQQNETLQTLVLDTNSIGDEGAEILAKHLSSKLPQHTGVYPVICASSTLTCTNSCEAWSCEIPHLLHHLCRISCSHTQLVHTLNLAAMVVLSMAGCPVGDAAIRKLNLTGNNIGDKGSTVLAEMLKVCTLCTPLKGCITLYPNAILCPDACTLLYHFAPRHCPEPASEQSSIPDGSCRPMEEVDAVHGHELFHRVVCVCSSTQRWCLSSSTATALTTMEPLLLQRPSQKTPP